MQHHSCLMYALSIWLLAKQIVSNNLQLWPNQIDETRVCRRNFNYNVELETFAIGAQCKYVFTTTNCFNIKSPKGQLLHHWITIIWVKVFGQSWHAGIGLKVFFFWYHKLSSLKAWMARDDLSIWCIIASVPSFPAFRTWI